jgi:hypothetical protein
MQALSLGETHVGWHFRSVAVPGSVTEVLAIRHMPPSNIDRSAIARLCERQTTEAATPIVQRGARR